MRTFVLVTIISILLAGCEQKPRAAGKDPGSKTDPLPSWNEGPLKQAIIGYVNKVTDNASGSFIPEGERIATFDNDGTLWAERPLMQELFAFYRVKEMVAKDSGLVKQQPFKAVIEEDKTYFAKGGEKAFIQLVNVTHTGMSERDFEKSVKNFFAESTYPPYNVPVWKAVYQPQIELLDYLRKNGFKTYICSGGTIEFMRGIVMDIYGIPKEQVIGTTFEYQFIDSTGSIMRLPAIIHFNDKEGKPVTIQEHLGRAPVFACGNEGGEGDIAMLKFCQSSKYPSFQLLVNHDDSTREFYYQEQSNRSLDEAAQNNWHVISMKRDWEKVFKFENP